MKFGNCKKLLEHPSGEIDSRLLKCLPFCFVQSVCKIRLNSENFTSNILDFKKSLNVDSAHGAVFTFYYVHFEIL